MNCEHLSATGIDQAPCDEHKVWRCDSCGFLYREVPVEEASRILGGVVYAIVPV